MNSKLNSSESNFLFTELSEEELEVYWGGINLSIDIYPSFGSNLGFNNAGHIGLSDGGTVSDLSISSGLDLGDLSIFVKGS